MHGTYEEVEGRPALRFERRFHHPAEKVWRAITEPDELAHWFPAKVDVDLRVGGRMTFTFPDEDEGQMQGEVTELDPPRVFEFSWGGDVLRFELEPDEEGTGCRLTFTSFLDERDTAARTAAGWHVCLDRLRQRLAGEPAEAPGSEPTDEWRAHYDEYLSRDVPSGAPVPGDG
jgi:uncharacterized protein YndB with AHSA1/START domain